MKTIFRSLAMAAIVAGIAVTGAFAQNVCDDLDGATAKYEAFLAIYQKKDIKDLDAIKSGLAGGKEFLEKWGACEAWAEQVKFVKGHVPRLDEMVSKMEKFKLLEPKFKAFDEAIKADNPDGIYTNGKEILAIESNNQNVKYVLAVAGVLDVSKALTAKTQSKYAAESLNHAKTLYEQLKSGSLVLNRKIGDKDSIGALKWERTREEAISQLAYTIGYVNFYGLNNKKAAVPTYYEVTQLPGFYKAYPPVFATIGDFYLSEAAPIGSEIAVIIQKIKDSIVEEEKVKLNEQAEAKEALFKGYLERAMDAYSRAWSVAKDTTPPEKTYKEGLKKEIDRLYQLRFEKMDGVNQWISSAVAKPLPNPTSTVEPIVDPKPDAATTTTTTGTGTGIGAANGTGTGAANGTGLGAAKGTGIGAAKGTGIGAASGTGLAPKPTVTAKKPRK